MAQNILSPPHGPAVSAADTDTCPNLTMSKALMDLKSGPSGNKSANLVTLHWTDGGASLTGEGKFGAAKN